MRQPGVRHSDFTGANDGASLNHNLHYFNDHAGANAGRATLYDLVFKHQRHHADAGGRIADDDDVDIRHDYAWQLPHTAHRRPKLLMPQCANHDGRRH
jgi:hypothetical protein